MKPLSVLCLFVLSLVVIARRVALLDRTVITATTRVRQIGPEVLALTTAEAVDLALAAVVLDVRPLRVVVSAIEEYVECWGDVVV